MNTYQKIFIITLTVENGTTAKIKMLNAGKETQQHGLTTTKRIILHQSNTNLNKRQSWRISNEHYRANYRSIIYNYSPDDVWHRYRGRKVH